MSYILCSDPLKISRPCQKAPTVLELFAGCGGMSEGFRMAGLDVVCASDSWDVAAETYKRNHPATQFVLGDIRDKEVKARIVDAFKDRECDILAGGFPCVSFSMSGKRDSEDPRGHLFEDFLDMVRLLQPKIVVGENVVGIKSAIHPREPYWDTNAPWLKDVEPGSYEASFLDAVVNEAVAWKIKRSLGEIGYNADYQTLNAADFGAPQARKRVIFIAIRNDLPFEEDFPEPTHGSGLIPYMTVRDAIGDLADHPEDKEWSHVFAVHKTSYRERIRNTPIGASVNPNYRDAWYRQPPDKPARTVKANNGGVFIHYERDRTMTPRELLRLQSFPDDYQFSGCKGDILKQIGNAVPPLLAKAIGTCVGNMLDSLDRNSQSTGTIADAGSPDSDRLLDTIRQAG